MSTQIDDAICIRQWDWSETSQVVWLFARAMGVVRALAKGSKRPKAAFSGGIELLSLGEIGVIVRPRSELALLTRWDLKESFPWLRRSLKAYQAGLYVADLVAHLVRDHDPHAKLYDASLSCIRSLASPDATAPAILRLQWAALSETGFAPELRANVSTGEVLGPASSYLFSPALGGMLLDEPGGPVGGGGGTESGVWRVRAGTIELLREISAENGSPGTVASDPESVDRANRLLASYVRHVLGAEPPTMRAVFGEHLRR